MQNIRLSHDVIPVGKCFIFSPQGRSQITDFNQCLFCYFKGIEPALNVNQDCLHLIKAIFSRFICESGSQN